MEKNPTGLQGTVSDGLIAACRENLELPPPARKTIDLEGRIVKDGVRKTLPDRQLALAELVHAVRECRKIAESKSLTLQRSDYAHAVHELNKAIDRADGFLSR